MTDPSPWQPLGAELADARRRTTLTQHAIARQLGISQAAYSQIERGMIRPQPALLGRLAIVLGMDVGRLSELADHPLERVLTMLMVG